MLSITFISNPSFALCMDYDLELLMEISRRSIFSEIETSTVELSKMLNVSQQTISRKLRELEEKGLIIRKSSPSGHKLRLSAKGVSELKELGKRLNLLFSKKKSSVSGTVFAGYGEGRYYMSIPQYKMQVKEKLGFLPFPGTLNVRCRPEDIDSFLFQLQPIGIQGFETKTRAFGGLTLYPVTCEGVKSAIVIPQRTRYGKDVMEIIAPVHLKTKLRIKDGDKVKVTA